MLARGRRPRPYGAYERVASPAWDRRSPSAPPPSLHDSDSTLTTDRQDCQRASPQQTRSRATRGTMARMETQKIYRGRLIDHIQLVVRDLGASKQFYRAVLEVLGIPLGGEVGDDYFWFDELFVSSVTSRASAGELTGRTHLAF